MKVKEFNPEQFRELLKYFPPDLEITGIDLTGENIRLSFTADFKAIMAEKQDATFKNSLAALNQILKHTSRMDISKDNEQKALNVNNTQKLRQAD